MTKQRRTQAPLAAPEEPPLPMRAPAALAIALVVIALTVAAGVGLNWAAQAKRPPEFANCHLATQLAPGRFAGPPAMCIDAKKDYSAVLSTSKGDIQLTFSKSAPITVNNFIVLAVNGYFNGQHFFAVQDWIVQAGDPQANGSGGPGYTLPPEPLGKDEHLTPGAMGMARFPDGSLSGSQYFILRGPWPGSEPTTVYNRFATVSGAGLSVVSQLDASDRITQIKIESSQPKKT